MEDTSCIFVTEINLFGFWMRALVCNTDSFFIDVTLLLRRFFTGHETYLEEWVDLSDFLVSFQLTHQDLLLLLKFFTKCINLQLVLLELASLLFQCNLLNLGLLSGHHLFIK